MSSFITLLITQTDGVQLFKTALKVNPNHDFEKFEPYYLEPEMKEQLMKLLPAHCRSIGNIVDVEEIFDIEDLSH